MMLHEVVAPLAAAGERLDAWLESRLAGLSRSRVAKAIRAGECAIANLAPVKVKPAYRLRGGEVVAIEVGELAPPQLEPEAMDLQVLHEDDDLLLLDKPPGVVVHPAPGHLHGTLLAGVLHRYRDAAAPPALIHRLDADTSGIIAVARHPAAHAFFQDAFRERRVDKRYLACLAGHPASDWWQATGALGRHPRDFRRRAVVPADTPGARDARTSFTVRERHDHHVLCEVRLWTGRTHQIRVHAAHAGHPVLADGLYGRSPRFPPTGAPLIERQALHAWRLTLPLPNRRELTRTAPLPTDLQPLVASASLPR